MTREEPRKRRRLFWYQDFQPGFIWGLGGAFMAALLAGVFSLLILGMALGRQAVPNIFPVLIVFNVITLLALLLIIYWVVLFVSHRMGGPLYRMGLIFEQLGRGRLDRRVNLRRDDQLQEVAEAINQGMSGLRQRVETLRGGLCSLQELEEEPSLRAEAERLCQEMDRLFVT